MTDYDLSSDEMSSAGEYGECVTCGYEFHWTRLTNLQAGSFCDDDLAEAQEREDATMYGISKDGASPYIYFDHTPGATDDYAARLLAVNRRQQPDATFEIVGPFTEADQQAHADADLLADTAAELDRFGGAL